MPISSYQGQIRSKVGTDLLLLPSVSGVVWSEERQLLLLQHTLDGPWSLPGGLIDPGEAPAQALVREISEETGVRIRPVRILGVFGGPEGFRRTYPNGDQVELVDIVFECQAIGGRLGCRDGEAVNVRYFDAVETALLPMEYPVNLGLLLRASKDAIYAWDEDWLELQSY